MKSQDKPEMPDEWTKAFGGGCEIQIVPNANQVDEELKTNYRALKHIAEAVKVKLGASSKEYDEAKDEYEKAKMQYVRSKHRKPTTQSGTRTLR